MNNNGKNTNNPKQKNGRTNGSRKDVLLLSVITIFVVGLFFCFFCKDSLFRANAIQSAVDESIQGAVEQYTNSDGTVDAEDVKAALNSAADSVKELDYVEAVHVGETSVCIDTPDFTMVYIPHVPETDAGGNESQIITIQPYFTDNIGTVSDELNCAPDRCAQKIADNNSGWLFSKNVDDSEVDLETLKSLDGFSVVLWHGHGGFAEDGSYGSYSFIGTQIKSNAWFNLKYRADLKARNMVKLVGGGIGITAGFFDKYYEAGDFDGTLFYIGTCCSGKTGDLAQTLINHGAEAVVVNDNIISRIYNLSMMNDVMDAFADGSTLQESLDYAKDLNGASDPYYAAKACVNIYGANNLTVSDLNNDSVPEATPTPEETKAPEEPVVSETIAPSSGDEVAAFNKLLNDRNAFLSFFDNLESVCGADGSVYGNYAIIDVNQDGWKELIVSFGYFSGRCAVFGYDSDAQEVYVMGSGITSLEGGIFVNQDTHRVVFAEPGAGCYGICIFEVGANSAQVSNETISLTEGPDGGYVYPDVGAIYGVEILTTNQFSFN